LEDIAKSIQKTQKEIELNEQLLSKATDKKDIAFFRKNILQLRTKENGLIAKENQLITKENQLRTEKNALTLRSIPITPDSFYDFIASGVLDTNTRVLKFASSTPAPRLYLPPDIYIRESWEKLYDEIQDGILNKNLTDIVVTGSPGIGKSLFAIYFMWRVQQPFLYERARDEVVLLSKGTMQEFSRRDHRSIPRGLPYFVDLKEIDLPHTSIANDAAYTIVFSSPNPLRFKVRQTQ
jgi:hypothetical protein